MASFSATADNCLMVSMCDVMSDDTATSDAVCHLSYCQKRSPVFRSFQHCSVYKGCRWFSFSLYCCFYNYEAIAARVDVR